MHCAPPGPSAPSQLLAVSCCHGLLSPKSSWSSCFTTPQPKLAKCLSTIYSLFMSVTGIQTHCSCSREAAGVHFQWIQLFWLRPGALLYLCEVVVELSTPQFITFVVSFYISSHRSLYALGLSFLLKPICTPEDFYPNLTKRAAVPSALCRNSSLVVTHSIV